ncbi:MAG: hypothetical protein PHV68_05045 [Candidatus Gastranaerophilales bacterium]|nr:hypothetical protein [Candidatus Gastranaerophilales bacterium]
MQVKSNNVNINTPNKNLIKNEVNKKPFTSNNQVAFGYYSVKSNNSTSLISGFFKTQAMMNSNKTTSVVDKTAPQQRFSWNNDLKTLFQNNKAVIYAMIPRTFNAKDTNGNQLIESNEQKGTFLNAVERLDELKSYGINTLHLLPIHPPGKKEAMGTAGSIYAPADYLKIDPMLDDPNNPKDVKEEMKTFLDECHKRGIRVMIDLPSCAALDMYYSQPELMATDEKGIPEVPQGWQDIRMFKPWADKENKALNKPLVDMHKQYVDMCVDLGIDGIRADVARAKPMEFWNEIIPYARSKDPQFAFLAESYTYEDASPMANVPADRPEDLLKVGFDSYYGQYHIFHEWPTAKEFHENMILNLEMSQKMPERKSLIGSFATHDDKSPMANGGVLYCNLTTGLQATLPMTNPYFVTGFESGDRYIYPYRDKENNSTDTDCTINVAHPEKLDIFNYSRKPEGDDPQIGKYMSNMMNIREKYSDIITKGSYIPLEVSSNKENQIIAFARHYNGKTLLVVANKDVNARESGNIKIPGLKAQQIADIAPAYGAQSNINASNGFLKVDLAPAKFHLFEISTPNIENQVEKIYKQK